MKRTVIVIFVLLLLGGCKVNKMAKTVVIKDHYIKNELLIQMNDLEQVAAMEKKFQKQGLKVTSEIAPWLKIVKAEYDTTRIQPEKMYAKLIISGYARDVEFNKRLSNRD